MSDATAGRRPAGELEASVLAALWAARGRALTPADVQRELGTSLGSSLARTTVTTILARLFEKGSVSRTRSGRGYAYLPVQDSPGLAARRMRTELDKSADDDRGTVLARFVSELAPDDEALLRSLLAHAGESVAAGGTISVEPAELLEPADTPDPSEGAELPGARTHRADRTHDRTHPTDGGAGG
ncbi:Predicted transcriptional regulator [Actinacidiphila rubida]|uniref:Predicted transcriptional regulator n=2 Tax=Actinacidiphila rubida TaxID=310780 RepID=A0A1H8DCE8_9ACTN|nr:Predicted transcriptional regulator [Actinacidiphila rubida]